MIIYKESIKEILKILGLKEGEIEPKKMAELDGFLDGFRDAVIEDYTK